MASTLPYRPPTNGTTTTANSSSSAGNRRTSLSSFPASRSGSTLSLSKLNRTPSRSPQPPPADQNRSSDGSSKTHSSDHVSLQHSSVFAQKSGSRHGEPTDDGGRYQHQRPKLKSQYPLGQGENHVEYILVASFDTDRGSIMEHQFPGAISGDEHMLAELMLPDQAHMRDQDWTIFFLHKDTTNELEEDGVEENARRRRRKRRVQERDRLVTGEAPDTDEQELGDESADEDEEGFIDDDDGYDSSEGSEGPPLIYVLNLVNTKPDKTAPRGARVKAMAICTKHSFLHIYKPFLLLALEEYFKSPHPATLALLYDAVNSMDLSLMPKLSYFERQILQSSDNKELFIEKFQEMIEQRAAEELDEKLASQRIEVSQDDEEKEGSSKPNGGFETSLARSPYPHDHRYALPRDTHEFESRVFYNSIPIPIKVPVAISPETVGDFSLIKLIQTFSTPHARDPQPFMLHPHLTTGGAYTHPIIVLVNAMLTQKRVMFVGHKLPSGEVVEAVLAACALASGGILRGFTRHAFPYTDLTKIDDLLKVPGFIAGVTNPAFANHPEWWDLLCDIPTGRMKISGSIEPAPVTEGLLYFQQQHPTHANPSNPSFPAPGTDPTGDHAFIEAVLRSIASRHGEGVIRAKWRDWVAKFTRIAAAFEESVYGASALYVGGEEEDAGSGASTGHGYVWLDESARQKELAGNVSRIEGWRNTRSYYSFIQDLAQAYTVRPVKSLDLAHLHDRLRILKLAHAESAAIYLALEAHIHTYDEICQLLMVTRESNAGLFYLSLGLFHPRPDVRMATVQLLSRIEDHEAGKHFWNGLSGFAKLAFFRLAREREGMGISGGGGDGIDERIAGGLLGVGKAS
ncbi:hypothetical protein FGG08_004752 [Glutinoglossum americanum]|uniref:UDENN domain-containing protein n=1 Tax=Glutinoglossum americanum TaxID=1670608 RepID=A0A9P8I4N2_9PEZI|nr:hypothetical protein FGG08_004752 [Glutinoglossum americanum]